MGSRILIFPSLQKFEELLGPPLLENPHERATNCLHLIARNLRNLSFAVDVAARNLLEVQITDDVRVHEDLCEFTRGDDKLWNEINSIVPVASKFSRRALIWPELAI